jgi:hypothetical protein
VPPDPPPPTRAHAYKNGEIDLETGEVIPDRPAQPELVPDDAVTVDPQGNVRDAGPFVAMLAELDRRGEP